DLVDELEHGRRELPHPGGDEGEPRGVDDALPAEHVPRPQPALAVDLAVLDEHLELARGERPAHAGRDDGPVAAGLDVGERLCDLKPAADRAAHQAHTAGDVAVLDALDRAAGLTGDDHLAPSG